MNGIKMPVVVVPKLTWFLFLVTHFIFYGQVCGSGIRLNVPRVRLPYFDTLSVNFTLHVDHPGCYKWTASRFDIIKLTTVDGKDFESEGIECSDKAVISTFSRAGSITLPASATVFAEEVNTKENVRCDVIIDKIESIKISTTNSYVHLEEAPSKFHVRGYGSHGNEFSTMEGVPMKWWLESPSEASTADPRATMRFLPFSESLYEAKPAIAALEARRLQGTEVLVEGLKTGSVVVNAKIQAPMYKHVPKTDVRIVAIANLLLDPAEFVIVPETTVPLKLIQLKQGRLFDIKLPSDTYIFEVENKTVAMYDSVTSTITGMVYGETKITVRDRYNLEYDLTDAITAYIYVREPKFLALNIKPYQNWALMMGQTYTITVDIFDADNQKFYVGNNIIVKTTFDKTLFRTEISSANGTYHVGQGVNTGSTKVTAELVHYIRRDGTTIAPTGSLKIHADMDIYQRIAISPKLTVLPWDPFTSPKHEIIFKPSGGNGNFLWTTTNSTVITVTQSGHARTESYGTANITAAMTINTHINGAARVYVLLPTSMKIVDHIVEAEIGAPILIPLAFYATAPDDPTEKLLEFTTCRYLNFKVQIEDPSFVYDSKTFYPHAKPACAYLPIRGNKLGSTLVTVGYSVGDKVFSDSVTVSTFKPLKVVEPYSTKTVLAVGSSRQLVFEGGPRPLLERVADFYRHMVVANTTVAKVSEVKTKELKDDLYIYEVVCHEVGETDVTLEIGNSRASDDRIPVRRTGVVKVICGDPAKIYFKIETELQQDGPSKCPQDLSSAQIVRIPVPNYENILVSVTVKDEKGNKFDNITSLNIRWTTSLDIVTFQSPTFLETEIIQVNEYTVPGKNYQTITPIGTSGNVEVTTTIMGYRDEVLKSYGIRSNIRLSKVEHKVEHLFQRSMSMELQLVGDVTLEPQSTTLFNHPSSRSLIKVIQGSGYFEVSSIPASIVETTYYANNKTILVKPIREGEVKVVVKDLCLSNRPTASTFIQVNGVGTILLTGADKIQVANSTVLTVQLFDKNGNSLTPEDMSLIKLRPISLTSDKIEIQSVDSLTTIQYKVTGKSVGEATVGFVAEGPSGTSKSEIKRILVFSPLTVQPKQLTLLVGSVYQLMAHGGPQSDSSIEFISESNSKVAVLPSGIILGKSIGSSKITARAIDMASDTLYSEDSADVNVVNLVGLRIHTPVNKLQVNEVMPVWAVGISQGGIELDPNILAGGKSPLMTFEWAIWSAGNADIEYPLQNFGIFPKNNEQPYFRFRAKRAGLVTIRLTANMTGSGKVFTAETTIEIHDELVILNLPIKYSPILMSPNSEISLKTNKDPTGRVTYTVTDFEGSWNDDLSIISVDSLGTLRSRDKIGDAVVRVSYTDYTSGMIETIGYVISVRLVAYHMLTPTLSVSFTPKRRNMDTIPRGLSFKMEVSYHDGLGRRFFVTNVIPKLRPNRLDIVQFTTANENNTFLCQSVSEGKVGFMAYNSQNPSTKDFLFFAVGEAIEPRLPRDLANVGDVVCFSCGVKSLDNSFGEWSAEPADILQLDSQTGTGVAVAPGPVTVKYSVPGAGSITSLDLTVRSVNKISFYGSATSGNMIVTIANADNYFDVPVKLGDNIESLKGNCMHDAFSAESVAAPFQCSLAFDKDDIVTVDRLFDVTGLFLLDKGYYVCRIKPLEHHKLVLLTSLIRSNLVLTAKLKSPEKEDRSRDSTGGTSAVTTQPLTLPFQPNFYLHTPKIEVSNKIPEGVIYLTGSTQLLNQLKIGLSDSSYLEIDKRGVTENDPYSNGAFIPTADQLKYHDKLPEGTETRGYRLKVLPAFWSYGDFSKTLTVSLVSQASNQFLEIPVTVRLASPFAVSDTDVSGFFMGFLRLFFGMSYLWLVVPALTVATLFVVHVFWRYFQEAGPKERSSEYVFVSQGSPRSSTPLNSHQHSRLGSMDSGSIGDGSPPMARRLYSTDSPFLTQRYSSGSSPNSSAFSR